MIETLPAHMAYQSTLTASCTPRPTAGQRAAADALRAAIASRESLILLFGDMGSGKTTLLNNVLNTANPDEFTVVSLSATSGEFLSPPTFDNLLEALCRRLVPSQPAKQRPATLAALATTVSAFDNDRTLLLAIDHADHLTDEVIAEVTQLAEYLDASPAGLVCVFVGSLRLASRIDSSLRGQGTNRRLAEIRLSQPTAEELAALLAYEDTAQPEGPMLTPDAIGLINAYAKSNLHWAVPMADAARSLAESDGKREVTPEMVRAALLEIWSPEQLQCEDSLRSKEPDGFTTSHLAPVSPPQSDAAAMQGTEEGIASTHGANRDSLESMPRASPGDRHTSEARAIIPAAFRPRVLGLAAVGFVLLVGSSILSFVLDGRFVDIESREAEGAGEQQDQQSRDPWTLAPTSEIGVFDRWRQQPYGSHANQPFITPPELPATATQTVAFWSDPPEEDTSNKIVPHGKSRKQRSKGMTSEKWVQTR
jgi:type II secretory pathway predicted ATPase ExeA